MLDFSRALFKATPQKVHFKTRDRRQDGIFLVWEYYVLMYVLSVGVIIELFASSLAAGL